MLLLGLLPPIAAHSDCPDGSAPLTESLAAHARRLDSLAPQCDADPGFLAWRGAVLLGLGRVSEAAEALERALLLDPGHQGARLDYARALAAQGEAAAAGELLGQIAARPDLPAPVRDWLSAVLPAPTFAAGWQGGGSLALWAGYDDNLNRASRLSSLALTLPDGELILPLAAGARARAGRFALADAQFQFRRGLAEGEALDLAGRAQLRATPGQRDLEQAQGEALLTWRTPAAAGGDWGLQLGAGEFRWAGETLQRTLRVGLRRAWEKQAACRPLAGVDLEARRHPAAAALDHRLFQAHAAWVCERERPWLAHFAVGREDATARPGGSAWRIAARVLALWPLGGGDRLEAEARLSLRREDGGYSPLLGNGARLAAGALGLRLDWRRPLAADWEFSAGFELETQRANLPLFSLARQAVMVGLVWRW